MQTGTFESECEQAVSELKAALIDLYDAGNADPKRPQDVARKLGINKTLTWNISRFLESPKPIEAISFAPGSASITKVAAAFPESPLLVEAKARVATAATRFDEMIAKHAGDRATLELIIDNALPDQADALELSRQLSFRGQSGIAGVQAKTRLATWFLAPNPADPDKVDMVNLRGLVHVRRLRPQVEWPMFKIRAWTSGEDQIVEEERWEPVDKNEDPKHPKLLKQFCRGPLPHVVADESRGGADYILRDGPVGNAGSFDSFWGELLRGAASRYATASDSIGEVGVSITMPCESMVFDLIYHRSMREVATVEPLVFNDIVARNQPTPGREDSRRLPMRPRVVPLAGPRPAVSTPLVPRYAEMAQMTFDRMGWDPSEFVGVRVEMEYPPLHSTILLRFQLPTKG